MSLLQDRTDEHSANSTGAFDGSDGALLPVFRLSSLADKTDKPRVLARPVPYRTRTKRNTALADAGNVVRPISDFRRLCVYLFLVRQERYKQRYGGVFGFSRRVSWDMGGDNGNLASRESSKSKMNENLSGALIGSSIGLSTIFFTWLKDRRRGNIDESTLVLGKWKDLVEQHRLDTEQHRHDILAIRDEFNAYRVASAHEKLALTNELTVVRDRLVKAESRIGELENENVGLKRLIAQNSQSTAVRFARNEGKAEDIEYARRIDLADKNIQERE